jgi:hypothetical protein
MRLEVATTTISAPDSFGNNLDAGLTSTGLVAQAAQAQ